MKEKRHQARKEERDTAQQCLKVIRLRTLLKHEIHDRKSHSYTITAASGSLHLHTRGENKSTSKQKKNSEILLFQIGQAIVKQIIEKWRYFDKQNLCPSPSNHKRIRAKKKGRKLCREREIQCPDVNGLHSDSSSRSFLPWCREDKDHNGKRKAQAEAEMKKPEGSLHSSEWSAGGGSECLLARLPAKLYY